MIVDEKNRYRKAFDATISEILAQAVRIVAAEPALAIPGATILRHQKKAAGVQRQHEQEGLLVPR